MSDERWERLRTRENRRAARMIRRIRRNWNPVVQLRLPTPAPRRARAELAARRAIDRAAIWLIERGCPRSAEWLWRACGMWR